MFNLHIKTTVWNVWLYNRQNYAMQVSSLRTIKPLEIQSYQGKTVTDGEKILFFIFGWLRKTGFETHRRRCEDNIEMDLTELGWRKMDWINLAQERDRRRTL